MSKLFAKETDLCAAFINGLPKAWTPYPETGGFDILLVAKNGWQIGIEAKLQLNPKVLLQATEGRNRWGGSEGPDFRAVLVPWGVQLGLCEIARKLSVTVIQQAPEDRDVKLPTPCESSRWYADEPWFDEAPLERLRLPDYLPRVKAGASAPIKLTDWTIQSMRLMVVLERRGHITRSDLKALRLSPSRWASSDGYLARGEMRGQWVASTHMPDFERIHPEVFGEIRADLKWQEGFDMNPQIQEGLL